MDVGCASFEIGITKRIRPANSIKDTIQTLSLEETTKIPFAISAGWKPNRLFDSRRLHQTSLQTSGVKSEAKSRQAIKLYSNYERSVV